MSSPLFLVLLSCHNGTRFLPALLDSLLDQEYEHYRLLIRDDASEDGTAALLEDYVRRFAERLTLLPSLPQDRLGPRESFRRLLGHGLKSPYPADFFLFADQDDVWLRHKLSVFAQRISAEGLSRSSPVLLHSDLSVVASDLRPVHPSYLHYQGLDARANRPGDLALVNTVTGCAMAVSRALAHCCGDVPPAAVMHDWWLALQASIHGRIVYIDEPLVLYRQHDANTLGAHRYERGTPMARLRALQKGGERDDYLTAAGRQAAAVIRQPSAQSLPRIDRWQLRLVAGLESSNSAGRLWRLLVHRVQARLRLRSREAQ